MLGNGLIEFAHNVSSIMVVSYLFKLQALLWNWFLSFCRVSYAYNGFYLEVRGDTKEILYIFFGCSVLGMGPFSNLYPTASKTQGLSRQLDHN